MTWSTLQDTTGSEAATGSTVASPAAVLLPDSVTTVSNAEVVIAATGQPPHSRLLL